MATTRLAPDAVTPLLRHDRIRRHTNRQVLRRLDRHTSERLSHLRHAEPGQVDERLQALDREWDVERGLELVASLVAATSLILGLTRHRRWFWLTGMVPAFLFLHVVQGWCPPLPVLRRLGVRTRQEIDDERMRLQSLRGNG